MKLLTQKEQLIFDKAGKGKDGEKAVIEHRRYIENYEAFHKEMGRQKEMYKYSAVREQTTVKGFEEYPNDDDFARPTRFRKMPDDMGYR